MTDQLLPTLPDAVIYSETLRQSLAERSAWSLDRWADNAGVGDVFALCLAIGLAGGLSVIGYTRVQTLPITHRVILIAAIAAVVSSAMLPQIAFAPLTNLLIGSCGVLALALEVIHRIRAIAAYAHIRTGEGP